MILETKYRTISTGRTLTSWLCDSAAEDLNAGYTALLIQTVLGAGAIKNAYVSRYNFCASTNSIARLRICLELLMTLSAV